MASLQTRPEAETDAATERQAVDGKPAAESAADDEAQASPPPVPAIVPESESVPEPTGGTGNLIGSINAVAESWSGRGWFDERHQGSGVPTPEELVGAAGDRGIEVSYEQRALSSLRAEDFPCVTLDREGRTTILVGRDDSGRFLCRSDGESFARWESELASGYSGVVFFVRPHPEGLAQDVATPEEFVAPEEKGLIASVFGEIARGHRQNMIQLAIASASSNLLLFAMPLFSMAIYDRVIPHLAMETLWALALGVTLALLVDFGLRSARMKLNDAVALNITSTLQARFYARILRARAGEISALGGTLQAGLREIENVAQLIPALVICLLVDLPFFILATVLLFSLAGVVALVPWVAAMFALALQLLADLGSQRVRESTRLNATQSNLLVETVAGRETVQALTAAGPLLRRWERLTDAAAYAGHLTRLHGNLATIAALIIGQGAVVATIVVGVYQIGAGAMSIGALSAATLLIGRMMSPMSQLGVYLHRLKQISGSVAAVDKVLAAKQEGASDVTAPARRIVGLLEFKDAAFAYPGEQAPALSGINLVIKPGERVGLIGRAGSGKSTLLKLIVRLHDVSGGACLIDGHDTRQYAPEQIRRHFAHMRQDCAPFDDTLRNAICFGLEKVSAEAFERAVTVSGVKEFAARHPAGYGLRLGPRGERLSGGERQAVMLARVLVSEPEAMLLDEPTSSMDNTMEMGLVKDLRELIGSRTFVVATHRAALLGLVDRLVWLDQGRIIADGPKAEVLKRMNGG